MGNGQGEFANLMELGGRLREERTRIGLTQAELGAIGGVSLNSQSDYENPDKTRQPNAAYLHAVARAGIDVGYVITGVRSQALPAAESRLVTKLRSASPVDQQTIARVITAILDDKAGVSPNPADNLPDERLLTKMFETLLRVADKLPADRRAKILAQSLPAALRAIEGDWIIEETPADDADELPLDEKRSA